jgi:phage FluMu protein Com
LTDFGFKCRYCNTINRITLENGELKKQAVVYLGHVGELPSPLLEPDEPNFLTPHAFWNIIDFGAKCERCETINTITLENGELKKQEKL